MTTTTTRRRDITGKRFGHLTVLSYAGNYVSPKGHVTPLWLCRCDCGNEKVVIVNYLRSKVRTPGCGCHIGATTHGMTGSPTYECWHAMIQRCCNVTSTSYARYGGRGITVCERWRTSFDNFLADMGPRPSKELSIDRYPDQNGNYEPGNCRWATDVEQNNNMRSNRLLTHNGQTMSMSQWSRVVGIKTGTIWERLRSGWSVDRALSERTNNCGPKTPAQEEPLFQPQGEPE